MFDNKATFYQLLEIEPDATPKQIHDAYLKVKSAFSKNSAALYGMVDTEESHHVLTEVERAFETLSDPTRRKNYDERFQSQKQGSGAESTAFSSATSPVAAPKPSDIQVDSKDEAVIHDPEWRGPTLRMIREGRNLSIEELSQYTKINKNYLKSIEEEEYSRLPALVFLRGFLLQIARKLKLPEEQVASAYLTRVKEYADSKNKV